MIFFVWIQAFTIFSLIYTPAPFVSTWGYPPHAVAWSMLLGIGLGTVAYLSAIMRVISFRTFQLIAGGVGLVCIGLSFFSVADYPNPRAMFLVYGIILTFGSGSMLYLSSHPQADPVIEEQTTYPEEREERHRRAA